MHQVIPAPSEEEFLAWLQQPATYGLKSLLKKRMDGLKEQWASGQFTDQSQHGTAILNAKAIGQCEVVEMILNLDFEQFYSELFDDGSDKHERPASPGSGSLAGTL